MTFDYFRLSYGEKFYEFINSELGQAMIMVLEKNDPASRVGALPPESQMANGPLFLGQITGWRDAITAIRDNMIQRKVPGLEPEPSYERDLDVSGFGVGAAPEPEAPTIQPTKKKKSK